MPQAPLALAAAAAAGAMVATLLARRRRRTPAPARVRHMVLVKLKPGTPSDAVDAMLAALRRLPARIPTILRIEVGRQVASLDDGRNASIGGLVEFASEGDYRAYAKHEAHVAVIRDYILPHMVDGGRTALQTSVDDWTPQAWTGPARTKNGRRRVAFEMRFDQNRLAEYKQRHERVWPEMQEALVRNGWHDYSLFCGSDGRAFGVFESDAPFSECCARMAREEVNQRWQREMAPFSITGEQPDAAAVELEHYFYLGTDVSTRE